MEKAKNRTDLLAAGKKKLQQFRQKKDNKGSSSSSNPQRKPTSRTSKSGTTIVVTGGESPHGHLLEAELAIASEPITASDKYVVLDDIFPLPVVASLVTLAGCAMGPIADDEQVPVYHPSPSSPSQPTGVSSDDANTGRRETDITLVASDDGPTLPTEAMQGNNLTAMDHQTENYEDGYRVAQQDDSSLLPCPTPKGVQQVDESPHPIHEVRNLEVDTPALSFSSDYNNHREGILDFPFLNSTAESSDGMDKVDFQSPVIDHMLDGGRTKEIDTSHTTKDVGDKEEVFLVPSDSLQPNSTCETSGAPHDIKGVATNETENNPRVTSGLVGYVATQEVNSHDTSVGIENETGLELERGTLVSAKKTCVPLCETPQKSTRTLVSAGCNSQHIVPPSSCIIEEIEHLKKQLYLTNIAKDFLKLQLHEDILAKVDRDMYLSEEVVRLHDLPKDHLMVQKELADCNVELQAANTKNEELESGLSCARSEVDALNNKSNTLQIQLEECQEQSAAFSVEFTKCQDSIENLQMENLKLKEDLISQAVEVKKLNVEKEHLIHENRSLTSKLLEQNTQLVVALNKQAELENELKESNIFIDELIKENLSLSISLNAIRYKFKELNDWHQTLYQAQESEKQAKCHKAENVVCDGTTNDIICHNERSLQQAKEEGSVNAAVFNTLKIHVSEIEVLIDKIGETIDGLHSDSLQARISDSNVSASGVSKLIHAFETKSNLYEASPALLHIQGEAPIDSLVFAKKQIADLRIAFRLLDMELEGIFLLRIRQENLLSVQQVEVDYHTQRFSRSDFEMKYHELINRLADYKLLVDTLQNQVEDISRNSAEEAGRFLNQIEMLQEKVNIGLILYNPMINGLQTQIVDIFRNATDEAGRFLNEIEVLEEEVYKNADTYKPQIVKLQNQMEDITKNAADVTKGFLNQIDVLQKEVDSSSSFLQKERKLTRDFLSAAFQKLDASTGLFVSNDLDYSSHISASVDAAVKVIDVLHEKLEALSLELDTTHSSYAELHQDHLKLQEKKVFAVEVLQRVNNELREIIRGPCLSEVKELITEDVDDLLENIQIDNAGLVKQLSSLLDERILLLSAKRELELLLMDRNLEIEEFNSRCSALSKKLEDLKEISVSADVSEGNPFCTPLLHLEALVASLLQRYEEAAEQIRLSSEYLRDITSSHELLSDTSSMSLPVLLNQHFIPKMVESVELQEKVKKITSVILQKEDEIKVLQESLYMMEAALERSKSDLHVKVTELEESEQRLSSVREKLSIAVAKGKGLIVQRNDLNQSLLEKSGELEKCLQELQAKEEMFHEVKAKLKLYSEADRVEALESELSYIRNSATAFRDSFLLKDSILQRIEEVLEELDFPENFHTKDIIEKIEVLARSVTGKSTSHLTEEDRNNSFGETYSDAHYGMTETWKEGTQPNPGTELHDLNSDAHYGMTETWKEGTQPNPGTKLHDLRTKYADLQKKYYGLAEQNDMLEQSLVKRNNLVQWWEEVVDRIEMPPNSRSVEAEVKIEWLISTFSEVRRERDSLLLKMNDLVESNDSLTALLQESQKKISELNSEFATLMYEREFLAESLDKLRHESLEFSEKAIQDELDKDHLCSEIAHLKEKLIDECQSKKQFTFSDEIKKLEEIILDAMPDADKEHTNPDDQRTMYLERLVVKLVESYKMLNLDKPTDHGSTEFLNHKAIVTPEELNMERNLMFLKEQLDETTHNLVILREENDAISRNLHSLILVNLDTTKQKDVLLEERDAEIERSKSLLLELDSLCKQRDSLDVQLSQEKQISASIREKLNVAVRKGKGLVQQRDSLKQTIVEQNEVLQRLQNEHNQSASEIVSLCNELAKAKHGLTERELTLNDLCVALNSFDFGKEVTVADPIQKLKGIIKFGSDWHALAVSYDREAKKAKRSSELLLAELNEVQERADVLQEDLLKAERAFAECSKQRDELEAARDAVLSQLDQFTTHCSEEREKQLADIIKLKSDIYKLRNQCFSFSHMLSCSFCEDGKCFKKLLSSTESILKLINGSATNNTTNSSNIQFSELSNEEKSLATSKLGLNILEPFDDESTREDIGLAGSVVCECMEELGDLKGKLQNHSLDIQQQVKSLFTLMEYIETEVVSERLSSELLRKEFIDLEIVKNDKEAEVNSLRKNVASLYETCRRLFFEIERRKAAREEFGSIVRPQGRIEAISIMQDYDDGETSGGLNVSLTENDIKAIEEILLSSIEGLVKFEELVLTNGQELKITISGLQHELQERDIQKNRICSEFVSQVEDAEATAKKYSMELDSAKSEIQQLEDKIISLENNNETLELKLKEILNLESLSKDLQDKIRHLTDSLHLKDQEIEGLMQALDEEESQLGNLESRNTVLEKLLQDKTLAFESLKASRAKAVAKLSTTLNKFDELHYLSENLLAEVENLQSQLEERDCEISFLQQEVTRCTNYASAEQEKSRKNSNEMHQLCKFMATILSRFGIHDTYLDNMSQIHDHTQSLEGQVSSILERLDELETALQKKDVSLKAERSRAEEHLRKIRSLETSLWERESQVELFQQARDSGQPSISSSKEPLEIETVRKKGASLSSVAPLVRSGRKANSEYVSVGIDLGQEGAIEEDDDKAHGFKALTMSRIVPKATRPIADKIDGLWVSIERLLMRQPSLRIGLIIYWVALHAMLAASI